MFKIKALPELDMRLVGLFQGLTNRIGISNYKIAQLFALVGGGGTMYLIVWYMASHGFLDWRSLCTLAIAYFYARSMLKWEQMDAIHTLRAEQQMMSGNAWIVRIGFLVWGLFGVGIVMGKALHGLHWSDFVTFMSLFGSPVLILYFAACTPPPQRRRGRVLERVPVRKRR